MLEKGWGAKQRPTAANFRVVVTPHSIQGSILPSVQSAKAALFKLGAVLAGYEIGSRDVTKLGGLEHCGFARTLMVR